MCIKFTWLNHKLIDQLRISVHYQSEVWACIEMMFFMKRYVSLAVLPSLHNCLLMISYPFKLMNLH